MYFTSNHYIFQLVLFNWGGDFIKFNRYDTFESFKADVLDILMLDEVRNNLMVGIVSKKGINNASRWLMSTITDKHGRIILIAICTPPFNLLLHEPLDKSNDKAVALLAASLKQIDFIPSGVMAAPELASSFTKAYFNDAQFEKPLKPHATMVVMKLDKLCKYEKAEGFCRTLTADDLTFAPLWEQAFCEECDIPVPSQAENKERVKIRLGKNSHFIWENGLPVAQAVYGRETLNGAVISWVYTPPFHRGKGYATSVVAELVTSLFERGKSFCCLFADASNPVSRNIYAKLGFYDVCRFDEYRFDKYIAPPIK